MSCAEAILFTSQSQLRTSKQSTGEREINVLHGAHSPPARPQINGVIYTALSKTKPEAGSWGLLVQEPAGTCPKPGCHPPLHSEWAQPPQATTFWRKTPPATRMVSPGTRPQSPQHLLLPTVPFVPLPRQPPPSRVLWTGELLKPE